uniref:Uncharacterized protein n=1 Tax=Arundo donax TaxID=35708 RepID=A0A0A9H3I5_ARUDO
MTRIRGLRFQNQELTLHHLTTTLKGRLGANRSARRDRRKQKQR